MKSFIAVSLFAAAAVAQSLNGLPDCAKSCVNLNNLGGCKSFDIKCICSSKQFIDGISCCVSKSCPNKSDQDATIKFAQGICAPQGVTNLPSSATCSSGAASTGAATGSTTAASNGTATTTAVVTTPTMAGNGTTGSNSTMATGSMTTPATSPTSGSGSSGSSGSGSGSSSGSSGAAAATMMANAAAVVGGVFMAALL